MKRGELIVVADASGAFSGKPRPALVVQADDVGAFHRTVTVCPITSVLMGGNVFRIPVGPGPLTGLMRASEIQIDKLQAVKREKITISIGRLSDGGMDLVDAALRRWLSL